MWTVNCNPGSIFTTAGMSIASPLSSISLGRGEMPKIKTLTTRNMKQVNRLTRSFSIWISVVENPVLVRTRQISVVSIAGHLLLPDGNDFPGLIPECVKP